MGIERLHRDPLLITHQETQRAIASIANAFDPANARAARGDANETELRETLSELVVADVLGRRKDGRAMPAGSVTAALDAALQQATNPAQIRDSGSPCSPASALANREPSGSRNHGRR